MLGTLTALVLLGPFAFTAPRSKLSFTLPADPAFCVILPEAKINPDGCSNESVETLAQKRKPLQSVKSNVLVATADKGTVLVTVHEWPVASRTTAAEEVGQFFHKLTKRESDEGRPITWNPKAGPDTSGMKFPIVTYNDVWTVEAYGEHELPDGTWHEARWLVLTTHAEVEILVQSSAARDVVSIGKAIMATLNVPEKLRVQLDGFEVKK